MGENQAFSKNLLGICHDIGFGCERDSAKAVAYLREAMALGHYDAINSLGGGWGWGSGWGGE